MIYTKEKLNFFINKDKKNAGRGHHPLYIGDNGSGARIIRPIIIASSFKIGANACVTHSILKKGKTIVGVPAHEIG